MLQQRLLVSLTSLVVSISTGATPASVMAQAQKNVSPLKVLLVTGGCCHDYDTQKNTLKQGLESRAHVEVTVVHQGGSATDSQIDLYQDANWSKGFDLVIHDECFADVKDSSWIQRILDPHRAGLPAVVLHCAMHSYRDGSDDWFKFCGVTSRQHGAHYAHEVLNHSSEHPIMKGFPAGWANPAGELYWIEKLWPTATPLAVARNREKGNQEVCVWTNNYGKTRVFGTTLGHHNETVESPVYLDLLARGVVWASGKDADQYLKMKDTDRLQLLKQREAEQALLAEVDLPSGFEATLFAQPPAVVYPVFVAAAPDGTVYVSVDLNGSLDKETKRGSIYRLRDLDGDGRADEVRLFVADVDSPRGLVWDHDRLYVMHPPHLSAFIDADHDGIAEKQEVLVKNIAFTFKDRPADHTSNGVTLGIDGWLYLAIGDFGFMEAEGTDGRKLQLRGGGVVRVRPDGTGLQLYSRGTRNILEVAVDPLLNGFTRDNTNDGGGWDIRLHHFTGLEDHGYPRLFRNFTNEIIAPLADYGGGSGCGALFLDEPGFPEGFGRALYTADWGRQKVYRHQLTPRGATFQADQHEFLGLPRVTDLDVDASSNLYITSWKGATFRYVGDKVGYLIRLTPTGYKARPLPRMSELSSAELINILRTDSHRRRLEAQRTLIRNGLSDDDRQRLLTLASDPNSKLESRVAAVFCLKQALGVASHAELIKVGTEPLIRPFAIRAIADRWDQKVTNGFLLMANGLSSRDPRTKLESIVATARVGNQSLGSSLAASLNHADPVIAHTAVQAMVELKAADPCWEIVDNARASQRHRRATLRVIQSLHDRKIVDGLIDRLTKERNPTRRQDLLSALCRLYNREGEWTGDSWGTRPDTRGPYYQPETWEQSENIGTVLESSLRTGELAEVEFLVRTASLNRIERPAFGEILQDRASMDKRFVPAVVVGLSAGEKVSKDSLRLFMEVAEGQDVGPALRSKAIVSLLSADGFAAFRAALAGLAQLDEEEPAVFRTTWNALHDRTVLIAHAADIQKLCDGDSQLGFWADAALLVLSEQKKLKGAAARVVKETLASGWATPARRERLLSAALKVDHRSFEPRVREALSDENIAVKAMARNVADQWKLSSGPAPGGPKVGSLDPDAAMALVLETKGDVDYGRQVFARLKCNNCHTVRPEEPVRGPYLPNVARTYKRNQLTESILKPSKSIAQGFVTNLFILDSGKSVVGFVTRESATEITIRDAEGQERKLSVEEIDERVAQKISVMPEGLAKDLTTGELAALVSYLETLSSRATKDVKPTSDP